MNKSFLSQEGKKTIKYAIILLLLSATAALVYELISSHLVRSIYNGTSISILNNLIKYQSTKPVEHYLGLADRLFYQYWVCFGVALPLCVMIYRFLNYGQKSDLAVEPVVIDHRSTKKFNFVRYFVYLLIFSLTLFFYYKFYNNLDSKPGISDVHAHIGFIRQLAQGNIVLPHFLYHLVVFCISKVSHLSFRVSSCLTLAFGVMFSTIMIERILRHFLKGRYSDYFLLFVSVSLTIVATIYLPFINKLPYLGTWGINPWHNPTYIAAKPFVLLVFYLYILEITKGTFFEKRFSLVRISISLVICTLIKPNFILALAPALIVFCFFLPGKKISMLLKTMLFLLPVLAVMVFQFIFTYYRDMSDPSSIQLCFFDVWRYYSKSVPMALLQAIAFPLAVLAVQLRRLSKDKILLFCWLLFIIGFLFFGFLCESWPRKYHANFVWGYMYCLHILFVYSTVSFLRWMSDTPNNIRAFQLKFHFCNLIFLFHLLSGIYYIRYLMAGHHL